MIVAVRSLVNEDYSDNWNSFLDPNVGIMFKRVCNTTFQKVYTSTRWIQIIYLKICQIIFETLQNVVLIILL